MWHWIQKCVCVVLPHQGAVLTCEAQSTNFAATWQLHTDEQMYFESMRNNQAVKDKHLRVWENYIAHQGGHLPLFSNFASWVYHFGPNKRAQLTTSQSISVLITLNTQPLTFFKRQHPISESTYVVHARTLSQEWLRGMNIGTLTLLCSFPTCAFSFKLFRSDPT